MAKISFLVVWVASFCGLSLGQSSELTFDPGAKPHRGLDVVYADFSKAYRELDHELVGRLYAPDAAYLVPGQDLTTGRDRITPTFKNFFDYVRERKGSMTISFRIVQRRVTKDMAYDVGIFTLTQYDSAGKGSVGQGKFVVVAIKEKSGEWKFQVDGYSDIAKPKE